MKEFLSQRSIPFREVDVSQDSRGAAEMVRLTGQRGVPVTVIDGQAVVGFDRGRLEQMIGQRQRPRLGAAVADASKMAAQGRGSVSQGAFVGRVTPGSVAAKAGLQPGDVIVSLAGQRIDDAVTLERVFARLTPGQAAPIIFMRDHQSMNGTLHLV